MKKSLITIYLVIINLMVVAQTNQLVWSNGRLIYGTPIKTIDSLTYGEMENIDTLFLLLPNSLSNIVHDTIYVDSNDNILIKPNYYNITHSCTEGVVVTLNQTKITKTTEGGNPTLSSAAQIATVSLTEGYTLEMVLVTMGETIVNWYADNKVIIPTNTTITGDIKVVVITKYINSDNTENEEITLLKNNFTAGSKASLASNAYVANMNQTLQAYTEVKYIDLILGDTRNSEGDYAITTPTTITNVCVWVFNANTNLMIEKLLDNESLTSINSEEVSRHVLRVNVNKHWNVPIYFGYSCTKNNAKSIGYYSESGNYLSGNEFNSDIALSATNGSVACQCLIYGKSTKTEQNNSPTNQDNNEVLYASAYGILPGEVDATKVNSLLETASINNKTVRFNDGEYIFSSTMNIPSNVSIIGNTKTIFKLSTSTSANVLMNLINSDNVYISHIILDGGLISQPNTEGNKIGMSVVSCRSINIENVEFIGWSKQGLYSKTMSSYGNSTDGKFFKQFQITNCRFYFNYCGNYFDYRCEYSQLLNCVWGENYIGTINCGGNNMYVSCQWNANNIGFKMENSGSNPAHGGCNSCTFNHNYQNAIEINNCVNGWSFDGCQIFYGAIKLNTCKGVIFNGNIWGSCKFHSTYSGVFNQNLITNTYFLTNSADILANNDGSTFVFCCLPDHLPSSPSTDTPISIIQ